MKRLIYTGQVNVYSISEDKYLRTCENEGDILELGDDEYYSFCMQVQYNGDGVYAWESAYVTVDDGEPWHWAAGEIPSWGSACFHIAYANMKKCMMQGAHTVVWYIDEQEVHRERFMVTQDMNWESVFRIPSNEEIRNHNRTSQVRSPYICGWFIIPNETKYKEYMIDFKADHVPKGTYCCLGNWSMDYSMIEKEYGNLQIDPNGTHAYAGFQNIYNGDKVGIMSFWDVFYKDAAGVEQKIRAKRVYPEKANSKEEFTGEGTGAHCSVPYAWEENRWYRMHLKCGTSRETGNTIVEQWVCDLETGKYTLICKYDVGVKNSSFKGSNAVFLENYMPEYSGEVRSMEVCNAKYLNADTNQWNMLTEAYIGPAGGLPGYEGSYNFGVSENRFWMITSGVGGDWFHNGKGKKTVKFEVE